LHCSRRALFNDPSVWFKYLPIALIGPKWSLLLQTLLLFGNTGGPQFTRAISYKMKEEEEEEEVGVVVVVEEEGKVHNLYNLFSWQLQQRRHFLIFQFLILRVDVETNYRNLFKTKSLHCFDYPTRNSSADSVDFDLIRFCFATWIGLNWLTSSNPLNWLIYSWEEISLIDWIELDDFVFGLDVDFEHESFEFRRLDYDWNWSELSVSSFWIRF